MFDILRFGDAEHGFTGHTQIPMVLRVSPIGQQQDILHADKQHYIVKEVFRGQGVKAGDEIILGWHHEEDAYDEADEKIKSSVNGAEVIEQLMVKLLLITNGERV